MAILTVVPALPYLRRARQRAALSQEELARKARVSRVTITRIELGTREPQPSTIRKLARALRLEPIDLMADEDEDEDEVRQ